MVDQTTDSAYDPDMDFFPTHRMWEMANDMRDLEDNAFLIDAVKLRKYKQIRADLEKMLAEFEGIELPEGHISGPLNTDDGSCEDCESEDEEPLIPQERSKLNGSPVLCLKHYSLRMATPRSER